MLITISEILNFPQFYEQIKKEKMPIATAYKLSKLKKDIDFHLNFYRESLQKIVFSCAQKTDSGEPKMSPDGENILLLPEKIQECTDRVQELSEFKVEVLDCYFTIEEFNNIELEVELLEPLLPFLEQNPTCE